MSKVHLVVPDQHAHPDFNNDRFLILSKLIVDLKPDVVINLGDMADMPSLCSYEKGKKSFEGRRIKKDIESALDAQDKIWHYINKFKQKRPHMVFCVGNHEERLNRIAEFSSEMDGLVSLQDLRLNDYWHTVVPYKEPVIVDGIAYCHFMTSGVMDTPIAGQYQASSLLTKKLMSCTVGHSHTRDMAERVAADGRRLQGLVAGCYVDYEADYAGQANKLWWSGVIIKREVNNGQYDPEFISMERLKKIYKGLVR